MQVSKGPIVLAVAIIAVGAGWLMTELNQASGMNWVWTLGLFAVGILTFLVSGGFDKVSLVVGPFFILAGAMSILRQRDVIAPALEAPILVTAVGVLLLAVQWPAVPLPKWYGPVPKADRKK
ncbi:MAG: hypothetical protein ACR2FY_11855 [Pirellulaceae bacterium]